MAPIPGAFDPPTYSPNTTAGLFGLGLGSQVGAAITSGQILAIGEGLAALHHRQIDGAAAPPIPTPADDLADLLAAVMAYRPQPRAWPRPRPPYLPHPRRRLPRLRGVVRVHREWRL